MVLSVYLISLILLLQKFTIKCDREFVISAFITNVFISKYFVNTVKMRGNVNICFAC